MAGTCPKCGKHALAYEPREKAYACYAVGCNWLDREGRTLNEITNGEQRNWELTGEEIIDAVEAHWVECRKVGVLDMAGADRAIARAAQRRVVEWMEKNNEALCFIHKDGHFDARLITGTLIMWPTDWKHLKAALGVE